ncbi:MAG: methyltransferase [uncultured bacterium]|nr:MAG: methyltransferase [uncultured bacterium]
MNEQILTEEGYDKLYKQGWCVGAEEGPTKRHQRRLIFDLVKGLNPKSILEVGCGDGINLKFFSHVFPQSQLNGVDLSGVGARLAAEKIPAATVMQLDASQEALQSEFDLVVSLDVLEHVPQDLAMLKNIYKMTKTRGHVLLMTLQGKMRKFETQIGHVRNYQKGQLESMALECGFQVERKIEWGFPFFSPLYRNILDTGSVNQMTYGKPGLFKQLASVMLYYLFFLNSRKRGDYIFLLLRK